MSRRNMNVTLQLTEHAEACPIAEVIERVGSKWSIRVLVAVTNAPMRFSDLERSIDGISRRMLTLTLRNLEKDGLVIRTVYPTVPPQVEYRASDMAVELAEPLAGLARWALKYRDRLLDKPEVAEERLPISEAS
jgi:DNA-binding HxlR family transcriptional regulator